MYLLQLSWESPGNSACFFVPSFLFYNCLLYLFLNHFCMCFWIYLIDCIDESLGFVNILKVRILSFLYQLHTFIKWKHCNLANRLYCTIQSKQCFEKMSKVLKFCFLKLVFPKTLFRRKADKENIFVNFQDYFGQI